MQFIPWQHIADWKCNACGLCCKAYSVVLNFPEWLRIVKYYGAEATASGLDKLFLNRKGDGSCVFLNNIPNAYACGLQQIKPKACKLWPFKILTKPQYGYSKEATYSYGENRFYVYVDSACTGFRHGNPTWEFRNNVIKEFVEIALGARVGQYKTTGNLNFLQL